MMIDRERNGTGYWVNLGIGLTTGKIHITEYNMFRLATQYAQDHDMELVSREHHSDAEPLPDIPANTRI